MRERDSLASTVPAIGRPELALHRVSTFVGLTLLFSWPYWFAVKAGLLKLSPAGAFAPAAAALATAAIFDGRAGLRAIGRRLFQRAPRADLLAASLLAPAMVLLALAVARPGPLAAFPPLLVPLVLAEVLIFTSLGEELGWRCFLLPALLQRFGPLRSSVMVGLVWALWHLPLFSIPGTAQAGIPFGYFAVNLVAFSLLYTVLFLHSAGSLVPALLLHTLSDSALAVAGLSVPASVESEAFWSAYFWLANGAAAIAAVALIRWGRATAPRPA